MSTGPATLMGSKIRQLGLLGLVVVLDQVSKHLIVNALAPGQTMPVLPTLGNKLCVARGRPIAELD